jgi:hypothetical protein
MRTKTVRTHREECTRVTDDQVPKHCRADRGGMTLKSRKRFSPLVSSHAETVIGASSADLGGVSRRSSPLRRGHANHDGFNVAVEV